jgi:hypothetical protein
MPSIGSIDCDGRRDGRAGVAGKNTLLSVRTRGAARRDVPQERGGACAPLRGIEALRGKPSRLSRSVTQWNDRRRRARRRHARRESQHLKCDAPSAFDASEEPGRLFGCNVGSTRGHPGTALCTWRVGRSANTRVNPPGRLVRCGAAAGDAWWWWLYIGVTAAPRARRRTAARCISGAKHVHDGARASCAAPCGAGCRRGCCCTPAGAA